MSEGDDRRVVKTYVPATQKAEWQEHAAEMDMSQSEFVRSMVQAGRRGFLEPRSSDSEPSNPEGEPLETWLREELAADGPLEWAEIIDRVEEQLEALLQEWQGSTVRHNPREGGYEVLRE
ncbi:MAG: DUF5805 domain-containing protein [Halobacteriaceae archaeon]